MCSSDLFLTAPLALLLAVSASTIGACAGPAAAPAPVVIRATAGAPPSRSEPAAPASDKERDEAPLAWERSEPEARQRAVREQRPMIVFLRADWSAASLELERAVWTDPAVRRAARRFVSVRIDVTDTQADAEYWSQRYSARGIPTTVVVDAEGKTVTTLHGAFPIEELLRALKQVD